MILGFETIISGFKNLFSPLVSYLNFIYYIKFNSCNKFVHVCSIFVISFSRMQLTKKEMTPQSSIEQSDIEPISEEDGKKTPEKTPEEMPQVVLGSKSLNTSYFWENHISLYQYLRL